MYYKEIKKLQEYYSEMYPNLTTYEVLNIAIGVQRNEILAAGLVVYPTEGHSIPTALEKIAMELHDMSMSDDLLNIRDTLKEMTP